MSSSAARQHWREKRKAYISNFIEDTGYRIRWITPYQARIDNRFDLYPTNGRYSILKDGYWGHWHTQEDIYKILQEHQL